MRKLLVFTENHLVGGGTRYMFDLVNGAIDAFDAVIFVCNRKAISDSEKAGMNEKETIVRLFFFSRASCYFALSFLPQKWRRLILFPVVLFEPLFLVCNILIFLYIIRKYRATHILSCNGGYPGSYAVLAMVLAARLMRKPSILSVVSYPVKRTGLRNVFMGFYEKILDKILWCANPLVVANANIIITALTTIRDMPTSCPSRVILNGICDALPLSRVSCNDRFVLGCIARMDKSKGVLFLLEAFIELSKKYPQLELVLAGYGDASARIEQIVRDQQLEQKVKLLGHYSGDVNTLLSTFDVYVFPSLWEGFPYSLIEAMRSGCTIVSTSVGGIPEMITDDVEGVLIQPGSSIAIKDAIEDLLNNSEKRAVLSKGARQRFEQKLTLGKMHASVRELIFDIFDEKNQYNFSQKNT